MKKILLVEDDAAIAELERDYLEVMALLSIFLRTVMRGSALL